jgi:hypothetical protein
MEGLLGSEQAMKNEHVISGLIGKRAELAARIENLQGQLKQSVIEMDHIDAALRIFHPDIDLEAITPRRVPNAHHAFRGEVSRIVLETLRKTGRPMTTRALTDSVMSERGLDVNDARLHRLMQQRVGACLNHWRRVRGALKSTSGPGGMLIWEVLPNNPLLEPQRS